MQNVFDVFFNFCYARSQRVARQETSCARRAARVFFVGQALSCPKIAQKRVHVTRLLMYGLVRFFRGYALEKEPKIGKN